MTNLTKEEIQLKEVFEILLRDGKNGRLFEPAKARFILLYTEERLENIAMSVGGQKTFDFILKQMKNDVEKIQNMIN